MSRMLITQLVSHAALLLFWQDVPPQPVPVAAPAVVPAMPAVRPSIPPGHKVLVKIVTVHDGDTVTAAAGGVKYQIRLDGIDAPELTQPYGKQAKAALAAKVLGQQFHVLSKAIDRYGRTVGVIYATGNRRGRSVTINGQMVQDGYAWMYRQYSRSLALRVYEDRARVNRWGLWAGENPEKPWVYRHRQASHTPASH